MSQVPCLPVPPPPSRRRGRTGRGKRRRQQRRVPGAGGDGDGRAAAARVVDGEGEAPPPPPPRTGNTIDSLGCVDAMSYLAAVSAEARAMPSVFVAANADADGDADADGAGGDDDLDLGGVNRETDADGEGDGATKKGGRYVPIDGSAAVAAYLTSGRADLPPCPPSALPPGGRPWIDATLADFSELRDYLRRCELAGVGQKQRQKRGQADPDPCGDGEEEFGGSAATAAARVRVPVPPMKDAAGWHEFCLGTDEAEGNAGGYFDDGGGDGGGEADGATDGVAMMAVDGEEGGAAPSRPTWREDLPVGGHPPAVRLLLQMDQVMTRRVLAHHSSFVADDDDDTAAGGWGCEMTHARAEWIYALLARVEKPLHSEDQASLRGLLRGCCRLRLDAAAVEGGGKSGGGDSGIGGGLDLPRGRRREKKLPLLNVLIAIVGVYFEQGPGAMVATSAVDSEPGTRK